MVQSNNITLSEHKLFISEATDDGYNRSSFITMLLSALERIADCADAEAFFEKAIEHLEQYYALNSVDDQHNTKSFSFVLYSVNEEILLSNVSKYSEGLDIPSIRISENKCVIIKKEFDDFITELQKVKNSWYDSFVVDNYLNKYINLARNIVFHPENTNLDSMAFRRSKTVESIYSVGRVPFECNDKAKCGYSYFDLYNPFVLDTIQRIIINFRDNFVRLKAISILNPVRNEIFLTQAERAFTRFTSYKSFSNYRVTLNRHNGEIISIPYNNISSIEEIKPLRLFEKIASFIQAVVKENHKKDKMPAALELHILIIGHTEPSVCSDGSSDQRELIDLVNSVLIWYQRSFSNYDDFIPLHLRIENILNEGDIFFAVDGNSKNEANQSWSIGNNTAHLSVYSRNYMSSFYFDSTEFECLCKDNDIIFILDCPWLTTENYDFNNYGQLYLYSRKLQSLNNRRMHNSDRNWQDDALDNKTRTIMQDLDTHFNRITSSGSTKGGAISRSFKDDLIKNLKKVIEQSSVTNKKDLYIFTSEGTGVDYSYIGGYPLSRTELYGGKRFTIVRFSNKSVDRLERLFYNDNQSFDIKIRLWSVLKYISVAYAFNRFRNELKKTLAELLTIPENYFEFLRDVFIIIKPAKNLKSKAIQISVDYSQRILYLASENQIDLEQLDNILSEAYQIVFQFIKSLYSNVIFADSDNFGDSFIRTAFEMNVYSSARNVNTMLFLNEYRIARTNHYLHNYQIKWNEKYSSEKIDDRNYSDEFFKDKKLYDYLLNILNSTDDLSIGTIAMLHSADKVFDTPNMAKKILENIISVCEEHSLTNEELYQNAINAKIGLS